MKFSVTYVLVKGGCLNFSILKIVLNTFYIMASIESAVSTALKRPYENSTKELVVRPKSILQPTLTVSLALCRPCADESREMKSTKLENGKNLILLQMCDGCVQLNQRMRYTHNDYVFGNSEKKKFKNNDD